MGKKQSRGWYPTSPVQEEAAPAAAARNLGDHHIFRIPRRLRSTPWELGFGSWDFLLLDLLVAAHQLGLREDVPLDRFFDRSTILERLAGQRNVHGIKAEEVAMLAVRRARADVAGLPHPV